MPPKRRTEKRRMDPAAELAAWSMVFQSGWDYFGDLSRLGVPMDEHNHRPDREAAEAAWHRLGARFLEEATDPVLGTPWAVSEFGDPGYAR